MTPSPPSLARTLTRPLFLACGLAAIAGTLISVLIFRAEYDELLDASLRAKAELLLPLMSAQVSAGGPVADHLARIEPADIEDGERAVFWLLDGSGRVLARSDAVPEGLLPVAGAGLASSDGFRHYTTAADAQGRLLQVAEPLRERNEALLDGLFATAFGMAVLTGLAFLFMFRSIREVQKSIVKLSRDIGRRNEGNLSPIEPATTFREMAPAVETLNALMARLGRAVEAERSFATNAAHELRTPLAVSLAHTQRLKAAVEAPEMVERVANVEDGLKRLIRLVERLLQFSRTQSGLGKSDVASDANLVIRLLFREAENRLDAPEGLRIHLPEGEFPSSIDPDALAIILSNLIDNAFKHSAGASDVTLDAREAGAVTITNDCDALTDADMAAIRNRFIRKSGTIDGYGVGLSIVTKLCGQAGAELEIASPIPGRSRGFSAVLRLPRP